MRDGIILMLSFYPFIPPSQVYRIQTHTITTLNPALSKQNTEPRNKKLSLKLPLLKPRRRRHGVTIRKRIVLVLVLALVVSRVPRPLHLRDGERLRGGRGPRRDGRGRLLYAQAREVGRRARRGGGVGIAPELGH